MSDAGRPSNIKGRAVVAADGSISGSDGGCIASIAHVPASGLYAITLDPAQDAAQNLVSCTPRGTAGDVGVNVEWASDVLINVRTFVAAVATDSAFDLKVEGVT